MPQATLPTKRNLEFQNHLGEYLKKKKPFKSSGKLSGAEKIEIVLKVNGFKFEKEFKFLSNRKFRFDFALPEHKIAIEYEGGVWFKRGGHTSGIGYTKDVEKYRLALLDGWRVLRYTVKDVQHNREWLVADHVKKLIGAL